MAGGFGNFSGGNVGYPNNAYARSNGGYAGGMSMQRSSGARVTVNHRTGIPSINARIFEGKPFVKKDGGQGVGYPRFYMEEGNFKYAFEVNFEIDLNGKGVKPGQCGWVKISKMPKNR